MIKQSVKCMLFMLSVLLAFGLFGCAAERTSTVSRVDVPKNSDPVLELMSNPARLSAKGDILGQFRIEDTVVFSFFSKYIDSMATQNMYRYNDICANTAINARMMELIRCRIAFFRLTGEDRWSCELEVISYTREKNDDGTVTIGVSAAESYSVKGKVSAPEQSSWRFVLGKNGDKNIILSAELLSRTADYVYDNLNDAFLATGLPQETPEQIHAAGDEIIRYLYKNKVMPCTKLHQPGNYLIAALPYTDDYILIYRTPPYTYEYGKNLVGLADKNGNVIFDVAYRGIGVTENGYFVLYNDAGFIIINPAGEQVAVYSYLSCHTVYENGVDAYYGADDLYNRPSAPYAAQKETSDGTEEFWLLGEEFQTLGASYTSLILTNDGAVATKDGSFYNLDKDGNIIDKKEAGVFKTFFGKYQLTIRYVSCLDGSARYGLTDMDGNVIYEQRYCKIEMPFEDRVVLYTGNNQSFMERAAVLADNKGNTINNQYNMITYLVTEEGYIGIAQSFGTDSEVEVGCKEAGCWLVDKDGNRVSEMYKQIGNYTNSLDGWLYINSEDTALPLMFQNEDGTMKTVPLEEVLIKLH